MARFCTECGKEIEAGVAFCTECGTKAPVDTAPKTDELSQPQEQPQPQVQPQPQPAPKATVDPTSKVVATGAYFGLMLLFSIPVIGFIACIIMTAAPKNKNLKNYAKATLIWTIIGLIFAGLIVGVILMLGNTFMEYINQLLEGKL